MTTTALTPPPAFATFPRRVVSVIRLNTANPWTTIIMPWMILGIIFVANWLIWWVIATASGTGNASTVAQGLQWSGASAWILFYMGVVAIQTINLTFPLALGYGVTRREFWVGTSVTFVLLSALYSLAMTALAALEEATNGWWIGGRMFTAAYFGDSWHQRLFIIFTLMMLFFSTGAAVAALFVRWKANGVVVFFAGLGFVLIGLIALVTFTDSWGLVGDTLGRLGYVGVLGWSYVITALAALFGYLVLRRATPRG